MIETKIVNVKKFIFDQKLILPALIYMAFTGERDLLVKIFGEENAYSIVASARQYAAMVAPYGLHDYPISLSQDGQLIKQPHRLAGLLIGKQENFLGMVCGLTPEKPFSYKFSKEEQKELDEFFLTLLKSPSNILDSPALDLPVNIPTPKKGTKDV